jgi:Tol biopolymer transport system component
VYFDEFTTGGAQVGQVSPKDGDVSYFDTPLIQNACITDIAGDGSELLIKDWAAHSADPFWIFALPNGPAQRVSSEFWFMQFLPGGNRFLAIQGRQLFIVDRDGGQKRQLMSLPESFPTDDIHSFAVSPDGARIRFSTSDSKMWESNLGGGGMRPFLPDHGEPMCCGSWSADGNIFVFSSAGREGDNLWAVTERGLPFYRVASKPVQLTNGPIPFRYSTVSKNGKKIFALGETLQGELSVYDAQVHEFRPFLNGISAGFVDFSHDGQWVAYVDYPAGTLWRSRLDGTQRLQLTLPSLGVILNPRWSPDGRFLVFSSWPNDESFDQRIYLVPADGGAPMLLLSGNLHPNDPTWSPDGKSIAYGGSVMGGEAPPTEIRILNLDTKESKKIPAPTELDSPRWSPDGRFVAALSHESTRLFVYSFDTKLWKELPVPPMPKQGRIGWPAWSHDSRYVYVMVDQPPGEKIYRYRIPNGTAELVGGTASSEIVCPVFRWDAWFGLTPDDRIMVLRDRGFDELYALDLEYR